jgi:hypothetical protein
MEPGSAPAAPALERCPVCQQPVRLLWVHAHLQCPSCRTVVLPCCNGERAEEP